MIKHEFKEFDRVLVRDSDDQRWSAALFSHPRTQECIGYPFAISGGASRKHCIPYNEVTKHLIGTSDPYIAPVESPVFEFGDVVKVSIFGEPVYEGIFSKISRETGEARCSVLLNIGGIASYNMETPLSCVTLLHKGNFIKEHTNE